MGLGLGGGNARKSSAVGTKKGVFVWVKGTLVDCTRKLGKLFWECPIVGGPFDHFWGGGEIDRYGGRGGRGPGDCA